MFLHKNNSQIGSTIFDLILTLFDFLCAWN